MTPVLSLIGPDVNYRGLNVDALQDKPWRRFRMWEFPHPSKKHSQNRRPPPGNVATAINFLSGVSQGKYTWSNNQGYAVVTSSLAFMSRLDDTDLAAIARRWSECNYRHNELIIAHGDSDRDVFFLLEGRARVTMFSEDGREIAYRDITPGEIFGELAGIDGKARSASVVALEPTRVARLSGAAFRDIVINQPTFAWLLLEHLSAQLRRMTDRVFEFSTLVVRKRLILELLRRAEEIGPLNGQVSLSPAPTHFELAAKISTHREAVSREMSALAKKGLIERRGRRLILHDLAVLERLAVKKE